MAVCSTSCLYHYLLGNEEVLDAILQRGLLPLSDLPESGWWKENCDFYKALYAILAEPILQRPYHNSGVFLTPIDFRRMPDMQLATRTRIAIPLDVLPSEVQSSPMRLTENGS